MANEAWLLWTALASNLATATSVIIALVVYFRERRQHLDSRALDRFLAVNEQYRDYLKIFIEHPELHEKVPYAPRASEESLEDRKSAALFELKVCELESAYFLYVKQRTKFERAQWQGWHDHMIDWLSNPKFREAWEGGLGDEYDRDFKRYMDGLLAELKARKKAPLQAGTIEPGKAEKEGATHECPTQALKRTPDSAA